MEMPSSQVASGTVVTDEPLLTISRLSKTFPGVKALSDVALSVHSGEIVALLGHNGSGKSTLVKILAGIYRADEGSDVQVASAMHFIHQDLGLVHGLSTIENLDIGAGTSMKDLLPTRRGREYKRARAGIARFGGDFDVTLPVGRISPAERTIVAIARATSSWTTSRNVLVLDEPTATLHGNEAERLRAVVRGFAADGAGILYISHHLAEVVELADRAIVLRDGAVVLNESRGAFDEDSLLRAISGDREIVENIQQRERQSGEVRLSVRGLRTDRIGGIDLDVHSTEILGISGLVGSGREQVLGALFGARHASMDALVVNGRPLRSGSTAVAMKAGVGFVPADRRGQAAVSTFTARENLTLSSLPRMSWRRPFLGIGRERREALAELAAVEVRPLDPERKFALFSGGNQQKVVIAKWLRRKPKVMLLDEPTQGVDVGARAGIHDLVREMADTGTGFIVASSDENELVQLCDRVIVMRDGVVAGELTGVDITEDNILRASLTSAQLGNTGGQS